MISQKSSHNFTAMFKESMKKSCGLSILFFVYSMFFAVVNIADKLWYKIKSPEEYKEMLSGQTAFFFSDMLNGDGWILANIFLILFAVLTAIILFNFQWSKKQCNVIYSLGMSRKEIFNSRILGGLVPMAGAMLASVIVETLFNVIDGSTLNAHYWIMALNVLLQWFAIYALAFILCAVVFSNTGNIIEGLVFTAVLSVFTMVLYFVLLQTKLLYTLGASQFDELTGNIWNWNAPFISDNLNRMGYMNGGMPPDYFADPPEYYLNIFNFSGIISAVVYGAALYLLGLFSAEKHKNENAGTWGKSKTATEITAAAAGLYAVTAVMFIFNEIFNAGDGNIGTFIICCIVFLAAMIIFKLIFSSKRKEAVKASVRRFPAYAAVLGAVTLVFALGMFGYSSYIPKPEKVESVELYSTSAKYNPDCAFSSVYGLKDMYCPMGDFYIDSSSVTTFKNPDEISEITKLHKTIISDGKIRNSSPKACANYLYLQYNMKNGKTVYRVYRETTMETVKKIMALNDFKTAKDTIAKRFDSAKVIVDSMKYLEDYIGKIEGREVIVQEDSQVVTKDGMYLGFIVYEYDNYNGTCSKVTYIKDSDNEYKTININGYEDVVNDGNNPFKTLTINDCYLFPKDMTKGYNIGVIDSEFYEALKKDISNQSAAQYFMHSAEDEIGILSFGLSESNVYTDNYEVYYEEGTTVVEYSGSGEMYTETVDDSEKPIPAVGEYAEGTSWNISSADIKTVVVTKDMVNTVKYLESHDMMKYFTPSRKVSDIKAVKLATAGELFGKTKLSQQYPVFFGAYWDSRIVGQYNDIGRERDHTFLKINNEITDAERISKLLDGSLIFGFCGEKSKIMEISYRDGSIATVLVPESVYQSVLG